MEIYYLLYIYIVSLICSLNDKNNNKKNWYYYNIYEKSIKILRNLDDNDINQTTEMYINYSKIKLFKKRFNV